MMPAGLKFLLMACGVACIASLAAAQETAPPRPLDFVRVYAPADRMDEWPLGDEKYVPVDAQEFERLAAIVERGREGAIATRRCFIAKLRGVAEAAGDQFRGRVTLEVEHDGAAAALLPLESWGLPITSAKWETPNEQPAVLGVAPDGRTALVVERDGKVDLEFAVSGEELATGERRFTLNLPATALAQWEIVAAAKSKLTVRGGLVTQTTDEANEARRYAIETLPGQMLELLLDSDEGVRPEPPAIASQTTTYVFSPNGVETIVDLQLDDATTLPPELELAVDPDLSFVAAQSGASTLDWRHAPNDAHRVFVRVPPLTDQPRLAMRFTSWCPLRAGVRWRLPGLRARNLAWRDGKLELVIPEPLGVTEIYGTQGMRQSRVNALVAPQTGESYTFDCHDADAQIELRLDERTPRLSVISGNTVEIGPRETTARTVCDIQAEDGETFALVGRVAPGWLIDDISSIADDQVREFERSPQDEALIVVHLKRSLRFGEALRLGISARRVNLRNGESAPLEMFEPIHWENAVNTRRLFSLRSSGEQRWRPTDSEQIQALSRQGLTPSERELLSAASEETLVALSGSDAAAQVLVEPRPQVFRAEPTADFLVALDELQEDYTLECVPEQGAMDAFLVRFSLRRESPVKWSCDAAIPVSVTAERLEPATAGDEGASGEIWQVRLWPPQTAPFRIRAERRTKIDGSAALGLIEAMGATSKQGLARVRADRQLQLHIAAEGPRPIPFSGEATSPPVRANYRYDPAHDVQRVAPAALTANIEARDADASPVLVRREELETAFTPAGNWHTHAHFELATRGATEWRVDLPAGARLLRVLQGGAPAKHRREVDRVLMQLDPRVEETAVEVEFVVDAGDVVAAPTVFPAPRVANATHPRAWRVNLPREWELVGLEEPWSCETAPSANWRTRLFGPLARSDADEPFAPWDTTAAWQGAGHPGDDHPSYVITGPSEGAPRIALRKRAAEGRSYLLIALLGGAIAWRLGRWRPAYFLAAPLALASVALVVGESHVWLASSAFLGATIAAVIAAIRDTRAARAKRHIDVPVYSGSTTHSLVVRVARLLFIGFVLLVGAGHAADLTSPQEVYRVLIAVDDQQQPVGGRYFVPQTLWSELRARAAGLTGELPSYLVTSADYTVGSPREAADGIAEVAAQYVIQSFKAPAELELPWDADFFRQIASIQLDGVALPVPKLAPLRARIENVGLHRLEMTFRTAATDAAERENVTLRILPHPQGRFNAWLKPGSTAQLQVKSPGVIESIAEGRITAHLGSAKELVVSTRRGAATVNNAPPVELEQLIWLTIAPHQVTAEVRHQLVAAGRPLRTLEFAVDPRWTLGATRAFGTDSRFETDGNLNRVRVNWPQPRTVGERFSLPLRLDSAAGIGEVGFPSVTPVGAVVRRRWCAVTIDPAVELTSLANAGQGGPNASLFAAAWGETATSPDRVLNWPLGGAPPNLQTALRQPRSLAEERLTWVAHADRLDARLEATIEVTKSPVYSYRVNAPVGFAVQEVSVLQEGAQQVAHWTRSDDGGLNIFLRRPAFGRQTIAVRGAWPLAGETVSLPPVGVAADEVSARSVRLLRHSDALVDQFAPAPRTVVETTEDAVIGRALGEWTLPQSQGTLSVRVRRNPVPAMALQVMTLREAANSWNCRVDCRVTAQNALVDELRWEIASDWSGPFTLDPAWPYTVSVLPGSTSKVLSVRPPQPQSGDVRLRIEAPLLLPAGAEPAAPTVRLLDVGRLQRLVALPFRSGERRLDWLLQNARPARLENSWVATENDGTTWKGFEIVGDDFSAVRQSDSRPSGAAKIELADAALRLEDDGSYRGRIRWLIDPGGLQQIPLRLPPGATVLSSQVMRTNVDARPDSAGGWLLPLVSDQLPQEVELLYAGKLDRAQSASPPLPQIPQIVVEASQSTLIGSPAWGVSATDSEASAYELAIARYRAAAAQLEKGLQKVGGAAGKASIAPDGQAWFDVHLDLVAEARATAMRFAGVMVDRAASRLAQAEVATLDDRVETALNRNPPWQQAWKAVSERAARAPSDSGSEAGVPGKRIVRFRGDANSDPPHLQFAASPYQAWLARYFWAAVLAIAAWRLSRAEWASFWSQRAQRNGWLLVCLFGAAWWLWLAPSVLGPLIIALGFVLLARQRQAMTASSAATRAYA